MLNVLSFHCCCKWNVIVIGIVESCLMSSDYIDMRKSEKSENVNAESKLSGVVGNVGSKF